MCATASKLNLGKENEKPNFHNLGGGGLSGGGYENLFVMCLSLCVRVCVYCGRKEVMKNRFECLMGWGGRRLYT